MGSEIMGAVGMSPVAQSENEDRRYLLLRHMSRPLCAFLNPLPTAGVGNILMVFQQDTKIG